jgi:pimeloyl-ACP methyl ester carboxylesterase
LGLVTSQGVGQYASGQASDKHVVIHDRSYRPDGTKRAVIWMHSAGGDAIEPVIASNNALPHLAAIASLGVPIISFDAAGGGAQAPAKHWGNDYAQARVTDALAYLRSKFGVHPTAAPILLGVSMGGLLALNYARLNPVAATGLMYPVVDLQAIHDGTGGASAGGAATTEAAHGGTLATFDAGVAAHNPQQNQAAYLGKTITMWHSDSDTVVGTANQTAFAQGVSSLVTRVLPGAAHADMTRIDPGVLAAFVAANL